ncbi:hypothetical protein TBS_04980 [Thermobispora bispora]
MALVSGRGTCACAGGAVREITFTRTELRDVRRMAAAEARRLGMDEDATAELMVAVSEVATNAVLHGAPPATARVWDEGGELLVEIRDEGRTWRPEAPPGLTRPAGLSTGGMGLWVARRLCKDLSVETGPGGTTVTMRFTLRSG